MANRRVRNRYAVWAEATEAIQKFGTMVKSPTGYPVQSPYVSIAMLGETRVTGPPIRRKTFGQEILCDYSFGRIRDDRRRYGQ